MKKEVILGVFIALFVAVFLSPFASGNPDGLERVAEDTGFVTASKGKEVIEAPMQDYVIPLFGETTISGSMAGLVGTCLTFGLMYGIGKIIVKKK